MNTTTNQPTRTENELALIKAKQEAAFALTPAGQYVKEFETMQRIGKMYAESTIVPNTYHGNIGNCIIAADMAKRMGAMPLMVMQNLYVVHGTPAFSSKFLIACINASKRFTPLRYEFKKNETACRCYSYEASDTAHSEPLYGDWITLEMAEKEGWSKKTGSKWLTMPTQMLRYRAAAFWCRVYCPEISMGLLTAEEATDIDPAELQQNATYNAPTSKRERVRQLLQQAEEVQPTIIEAEVVEAATPAENNYDEEAEMFFNS